MCIICVELDKNSLAPWEAKRNLKEMGPKIDEKHAKEVEKKIIELEKEDFFSFFLKKQEKA